MAPKQRRQISSGARLYLATYSLAQAFGWGVVVSSVISELLENPHDPYGAALKVSDTVWYVQLSALFLDIGHTLLGITPSSLLTVLLQQGGRVLILGLLRYGGDFYPPYLIYIPALLFVAYGAAELIRYPYYALKMFNISPYWLEWLRYSSFYLFYPLGFTGEFGVIYSCLSPARRTHEGLYYFVLFGNLILVAIGTHLLKHMIRQRRNVLGKQHGKKA